MSGYLEGYRAGEERREKIIRWSLVSILLLAIAAGLVYWFAFRDRSEKQRIDAFFQHLRNADYKAAYALWGCSEQTPCPDYKFEKFLEDWGPKSAHADVAVAKLGQVKSCRSGIIQFVQFPNQPDITLWVERSSLNLGFAPWPVCNPRMPAGGQ